MNKQETVAAFQEIWESSNSEQPIQPLVLEKLTPQRSLKINFNCIHMNLGLGGGNRVKPRSLNREIL